MKTLTHGDIAELAKAGKLNDHLRDVWRRKTGEDPVRVAMIIAMQDRKRTVRTWIGNGLTFGGIVVFFAPIFLAANNGIDFAASEYWRFAPIPGFVVMCFGIGVSLHVMHFLPTGHEGFSQEATQFPWRLQRLLEDGGINDPTLISTMKEKDLRGIASTILEEIALQIVATESRPYAYTSRRDYERTFDWAHQYLHNFGLVSAQINRYFDKARARHEERLKEKTELFVYGP